MERKNNIEMNKLFISCLSIFVLCSAGYSQTYVYDKNLKVSLQIMVELKTVQASKETHLSRRCTQSEVFKEKSLHQSN